MGHTGYAAFCRRLRLARAFIAVADPGPDPRTARGHLGDASPARRAGAHAGAYRIACLCHRAHRTQPSCRPIPVRRWRVAGRWRAWRWNWSMPPWRSLFDEPTLDTQAVGQKPGPTCWRRSTNPAPRGPARAHRSRTTRHSCRNRYCTWSIPRAMDQQPRSGLCLCGCARPAVSRSAGTQRCRGAF